MQWEGALVARTNALRMETRDIAAVLIGLQVGLVIGLLAVGTTLLAPLGVGLVGAAAGFGIRRARLELIRRALRSQLRGAR